MSVKRCVSHDDTRFLQFLLPSTPFLPQSYIFQTMLEVAAGAQIPPVIPVFPDSGQRWEMSPLCLRVQPTLIQWVVHLAQ